MAKARESRPPEGTANSATPLYNTVKVAGQSVRRKVYPASKERRVRYPATDDAAGSPMLQMLRDAGIRMAPLNRIRPGTGHWIGDCPRCHGEDKLFVLPDGAHFETACDCWRGTGGVFGLFSLLLTR